jgi:hypothetical protein
MYISEFGWKCWSSFCYHTIEIFQNHFLLPFTYTLCVIFPTHNCPHMTENSAIRQPECSQWQLSFHYSIILSGNILDAYNKKGNYTLFMNQLNNPNAAAYSLIIPVYICHRKQCHKNRSITFNDNFHITFHSLFLQANQTCMLWWWPKINEKCHLQRLGSNVHLVMCHMRNALVKAYSLATLNSTRHIL